MPICLAAQNPLIPPLYLPESHLPLLNSGPLLTRSSPMVAGTKMGSSLFMPLQRGWALGQVASL